MSKIVCDSVIHLQLPATERCHIQGDLSTPSRFKLDDFIYNPSRDFGRDDRGVLGKMCDAQNPDKNKAFPAPRGMGCVPWRRNAKLNTAVDWIRRP